jgi:hypothetical protein
MPFSPGRTVDRIHWRNVWIGAAVARALLATGKVLIGLYLGKDGDGISHEKDHLRKDAP